ncbi:methionine gamma-lyase family protein [Eubacteriales bacterium OttesenSCG-928-A19]|nr:methionine gamma-lyase family protein [Eubacteriales bacterium OttesenSCG-928-A19]
MRRYEKMIDAAESQLSPVWEHIREVERQRFEGVLSAFQEERIAVAHFAPSTGYGYDDMGRDTLERVYARVLGCERALVRPQIVSGTHALAVALFGLLRPGDRLLSAVGRPYDTLEQVIGMDGPSDGSLADFGVGYDQAELTEDELPDMDAIVRGIKKSTRVVLVQRSRGYAWRPSLTIDQIGEICAAVHSAKPDAMVLVDNCYGEFTELREPSAVQADVLVGSLIKNPGGGLAPTGGYIAGRADLMERVATRLTSPGIGAEVGSYAASYQPFYQGLFLAPHVVAQALMGATLAAAAFGQAGFAVSPTPEGVRSDVIQAICLKSPERVIAFCQAIQAASPVDSFAMPEPWDMPGYQHQVIMAAGTFISGASIELSADAPIRPPYNVYLQGGLTYEHCRIAVMRALSAVLEA